MLVSPLFAVFVLLATTVALVPLAKAGGLGTILGYLAAGVIVGPYGLGLISDSETVRSVAEFGIVLMLFLIGIELQPTELWRMRRRIMGLGLSQLVLTGVAIGGILMAAGLRWQAALIAGLSFAMSSTAIAMQTVAQRGETRSPAGRSALAILLVQDVAVVPILAVIPFIATLSGSLPDAAGESARKAAEAVQHSVDWETGLKIVLVFGFTILAGRYLVRPVMRFIAETGVREAFTALGLALVIGAALLMEWIGLSAAFGAFMGGVMLADSEYRHELESDIEPFKGLLLGLFFISVGMSITFSEVLVQPLMILALLLGLITIKIAIIYGIGVIFRIDPANRTLLALLLSQAGEFAFVLLQFAQDNRAIAPALHSSLVVVVALSMAVTPVLVLVFDRVLAPRLDHRPPAKPGEIDGGRRVLVLGYGRFGQIVTRMLRAQGFETTLIDDDPAQIALVKRFGVKVFYGDGTRLDILRASGADAAELVVIAVPGRERITAIANLVKRNFPDTRIAARAVDRAHAHDLMAIGVDVFERETYHSALSLGAKALMTLGYSEEEANRLASDFRRHDDALLEQSFALRDDQDAYIGFIRRSTEMLEQVMRADRERQEPPSGNSTPDAPAEAAPGAPDIDKRADAGSD